MNNNIQDLIEFCEQEIDTLVQLCQDSHSETATLVNMGSITAYKEIQKKLKEQLTNKEIKMTNVFTDQASFMTASDQTVGEYNEAQYKLYLNLIREEFNELQVAIDDNDKVEQLDALLDMQVVILGSLHSLGVDAIGAWNEVIRSNMSKIDPETGKVKKREDGKVLKPATFSPPNLVPFIKENT